MFLPLHLEGPSIRRVLYAGARHVAAKQRPCLSLAPRVPLGAGTPPLEPRPSGPREWPAPATAGPLALTLDQCIISAITVTVTVLDTKTGADDTSATFYYELPTVFDVDTAAVVSGGHSSNPFAGVTRTFSRVINVPAEHRLEMPRRVARRTAKH